MSQAGIVNSGNNGGGSDVLTLTGDSGGPVSPDSSGNININGASTISVSGNPGAHSLTITTSSPSYSTGNWTPTISIGANTFSYVTQSGNYVAIGGLVIAYYTVVWQNIVGATLHPLQLNLPFSVGAYSGEHFVRIGGITLDSGYTDLVFTPQNTQTYASAEEIGSGEAGAVFQMNASSAVGPYTIAGMIVYRNS